VSFGEFTKAHGASELGHLPDHVEPFVVVRVRERAGGRSSARRKKAGQEVRNPIRQMLRLAIPGYIGLVRPHKPNNPFEQQAPQFLTHLAEEKGLRARSMLHYRHHLHQFATYLQRIGIKDLATRHGR
jgi:integrase/recombinase XerD